MKKSAKQDRSFGEYLRRMRKAHDMTQLELAECTGISLAKISRYEHCEHPLLPEDEMGRLANAFQHTTESLLGLYGTFCKVPGSTSNCYNVTLTIGDYVDQEKLLCETRKAFFAGII